MHSWIQLPFCCIIADLKSALGKRRRDGKSAGPQPLTVLQRVHIGRLVEKYGDDYQVILAFSLSESTVNSLPRREKPAIKPLMTSIVLI